MTASFVHLHVHSQYSILDGAARAEDLFAEAERLGMPAVAVTDHGNLYGAYSFWKASRGMAVKPIIGIEAYVAPESRHHKAPVFWGRNTQRGVDEFGEGGDVSGAGAYTHMTMLAANAAGLRNLFRLSSLASFEGHYRRPRMDAELITQYAEGIIATTGCPSGEVQTRLRLGQHKQALDAAARYRDIFGPENFFLELMDHGLTIERSVRDGLLDIGQKLNLPPLATNDCHYTRQVDAGTHDALLCQPPGTLVRRIIPRSKAGTPRGTEFPTLTEDVPIETIRVGDRVVSWSGKQRRGTVHRSGSLVSQIGIREYSDEIVGVRTDSGLTSRYTYDHKTIVRLDGKLSAGNFVVYLMRRGALFRIGVTQYRRKGRGCDLGPMYRLKEESGDDVWVLSAHKSLDDAREQEAWVGYQYNIPTWTFTAPDDRCGGRKAFYARIWGRIGSDLGDRAKACLADFDRDLRFPLLTRGPLFITRPQVVRACNLLSGMLACAPGGETTRTYDGTGVWRPVEVFRETYSGPVYSMEVEDDHTYIADGIVTHNCVQTKATLATADRFRFDGDGYYLKPPAEMRDYWDREVPGAADNTLLVADRIDSYDEVFTHTDRTPRVPLDPGDTEDEALRRAAMEGLTALFPAGAPEGYQQRLDAELAVISRMGFPGYFLVVADATQWATRHDITYRGRGSAAGSLVAYTLGVTDLDPLVHGLLFERFINPDRVSPPDIDIDVDESRRTEMVRYLADRWGSANVAQVITFGTIKTRSAIKDAARVLHGKPGYALAERITKALPPPVHAEDVSLAVLNDPAAARYRETGALRDLAENDEQVAEVLRTAQGMEGLVRNAGVHACGVILSSQPLLDVVPLWRREADDAVITGWDYPSCENIGLLKIDVLGSRTLQVITTALAVIQANHGISLDLKTLPLDNPAVYDLLSRGDTLGVFQLDGSGARALCRRVRPTRFTDIPAMLALYRPGPMAANAHNDYADRKNGRQDTRPIHPELAEPLADVLGDTHHLAVYQEDVMAIARKVAGYTLAQADLLRRAMGKKKKDILDREYARFRDGMAANGYSAECTHVLWDVLLPFSDYAFVRSHAVSYGLVSYWTAYLKAHYAPEFMAAQLSSIADDKDRCAVYLAECRRTGLKVLPPDVNASGLRYTVIDGTIRVGLGAIRDVGDQVVSSIIATRDTSGPFTSFIDFLEKIEPGACNKRVIESLITAGAFDSLGHARAGLLDIHADAVDTITGTKRQEAIGQFDLFGAEGGALTDLRIPTREWPTRELLRRERDMLGLYVSAHPLDGTEHALRRFAPVSIGELEDPEEGTEVTVAGLVASVTRKLSKKGTPWAAVTVEDLDAGIEVLAFGELHEQVLIPDAVVGVRGRARWRDDALTVIATDVVALNLVATIDPLTLRVNPDQVDAGTVSALRDVFSAHPGATPVQLLVRDATLSVERYHVTVSPALLTALRPLAGVVSMVGAGVAA